MRQSLDLENNYKQFNICITKICGLMTTLTRNYISSKNVVKTFYMHMVLASVRLWCVANTYSK